MPADDTTADPGEDPARFKAEDELVAAVLYQAYVDHAYGGRETAEESAEHDAAYDRLRDALDTHWRLATVAAGPALVELVAAVNDTGPRPDVHRKILARHRREAPAVWAAIDALLRHVGGAR